MARYQRAARDWRSEPATEPQHAKIAEIASEHIVPLALLNELERQQGEGSFTKGQASAWIEILKYTPAVPKSPEEQPASEPGMYQFDGTLYEVKFNRKTGRLNVFDAKSGEYARGIAPKLKAGHKVAGAESAA